jgi:hypothetical protein
VTPKKSSQPQQGRAEEKASDSPGISGGGDWRHESNKGLGREKMDWVASVFDKKILHQTGSRALADW